VDTKQGYALMKIRKSFKNSAKKELKKPKNNSFFLNSDIFPLGWMVFWFGMS